MTIILPKTTDQHGEEEGKEEDEGKAYSDDGRRRDHQ
jgi:hypothetical protein